MTICIVSYYVPWFEYVSFVFKTIDTMLLKYRSALTRNKTSSSHTTGGRTRKNIATSLGNDSVDQIPSRATFTSTTQAALLESKTTQAALLESKTTQISEGTE
eukprot:Pgem_evm2s5792